MWRRLGFWVGPLLLIGSLLLGLVLVLIAPYVLLLLVPAGGLLLGVWLIVRGPEPQWAKLLALAPVLAPLLLLGLVIPAQIPAGLDLQLFRCFHQDSVASADFILLVLLMLINNILFSYLLACY